MKYATKIFRRCPPNGIGGGFGGGNFAVADELAGDMPPVEPNEQDQQTEFIPQESSVPISPDPLVRTELQAADAIGLGNVSTLQSFQGSRVLYWDGRLFNCMGDKIVCTSATSGKQVWSRQIEGDLSEIGGHLDTPPIAAGEFLFVATVDGVILQLKPLSGEVAASFPVAAPVRFPPVINEGRIYVGTQDGQLVCIDIRHMFCEAAVRSASRCKAGNRCKRGRKRNGAVGYVHTDGSPRRTCFRGSRTTGEELSF